MIRLLYFGAGLLIGGVIGWVLKKKKIKDEEEQEEFEYVVSSREEEKANEDFAKTKEEMNEILKGYTVVNSMDELEDYLGKMEYPEDDMPDVTDTRSTLEQCSEECYYNDNLGHEKRSLVIANQRVFDEIDEGLINGSSNNIVWFVGKKGECDFEVYRDLGDDTE